MTSSDHPDSWPPASGLGTTLGVDATTFDGSRPTVVGAYELTELIGRGGMGSVYRGQRREGGFKQEVAIKLLNTAVTDPNAIQRFRQERQILAALEHPHIARLIDGGEVADGTPYLVLEYVAGTTITEYCDVRGLSIKDRLRLFRGVLEGVSHAHSKLIVHRDIKPTNILVTASGTPKLLDFGVAKLLTTHVDSGDAMVQTAAAGRLLTPYYASPEQLRGENITTATDVYSLGVLLYELVTSQHPFHSKRDNFAELYRAIIDGNVTRPSVVTAKTLRQRAAPQHRSGDLHAPMDRASRRARRRRLGVELDQIILTAMHPDPEQRYPSAERLRDDIDRYLDGRPIHAAPASRGYVMRKFVLRHPMELALTLALFVAITGFGVHARLQAQALAAERDRAEQIKDFVVELFNKADPVNSDGRDVTVRNAIASGAEDIKGAFVDQPLLRAELLHLLAEMTGNLGDYEEALRLSTASTELFVAHAPPLSAERIIAEQAHAHHLHLAGRREAARTWLTDLVRRIERAPPGQLSNLSAAMTYNQLFQIQFEAREIEAAEATIAKAFTHYEAAGRPANLSATVMHRVNLLRAQERLDEAAELLAALQTRLEETGEQGVYQRGRTRLDLAGIQKDLGRYEDAAPNYRAALADYEAVFGGEHPEYARALNNYGHFLRLRGDPDEAIEVLQRALTITQQTLGPDHADNAAKAQNLAASFRDAGHHARALELFEETLRLDRLHLGEQHPFVVSTLANIADLHLAQGDLARAAEAANKGAAIADIALPTNHRFARNVQRMQAQIALRQGRAAEALALYEALLAPLADPPAQGSVRDAELLMEVAEVDLALSQPARARERLEHAARIFERHDHPSAAQAKARLAALD